MLVLVLAVGNSSSNSSNKFPLLFFTTTFGAGGSGSVVIKNIKKNSVYAGIPAKKIGVLEWKKLQYLQQQEVIFLF